MAVPCLAAPLVWRPVRSCTYQGSRRFARTSPAVPAGTPAVPSATAVADVDAAGGGVVHVDTRLEVAAVEPGDQSRMAVEFAAGVRLRRWARRP